jgi:hypothetical protein
LVAIEDCRAPENHVPAGTRAHLVSGDRKVCGLLEMGAANLALRKLNSILGEPDRPGRREP